MSSKAALRQLFFDTETTGIGDGHRILEIGIVEMVDRQLTGQTKHWLINPERDINEEAIRVHGISHQKIANQPTFAEIVDEVMSFINGDPLIIHNAPFDVGMMNDEFRRLKQQGINRYDTLEDCCTIIDSLKIARQLYPGKSNRLDVLCDRLGVNRKQRVLHNSILDCQLLSEVYLRMTSGQQLLFDSAAADQSQQTALQDYSGLDLPRIRLSKEERQRHQDYMQGIHSKASPNS